MQSISAVSDQLPSGCWPVDNIAELEQRLCRLHDGSSYTLMWQAGEALATLVAQKIFQDATLFSVMWYR